MNSSLLNLLERVYGVSKKENGNYYSFYSPFIEHHNPKLNIDLETGKWKCWKSNTFGDSINSLFKRTNVPKRYFDELRILIPEEKRLYSKSKNNKIELPKEFIPLSIPTNDLLYKKAYGYLIGRNLTMYDIIYYNLGYCATGDYKNHIIIPSYDSNQELNYYISRDMNPGGRYKNIPSSIIKKSEITFFESNINWNFPINLVEGVFDAITLKRNTIPLLGKELYDSTLIKLLLNKVELVNVYFDNDVTYKEKEKIYNKLTSYNIECKIWDLISGKDINDVGYDNILNNITNFEMDFKTQIDRRLCQE